MSEEWGLSYVDALAKSFKIVKRDSSLFEMDESDKKYQVKTLVQAYTDMDPDCACQKIRSLESDQEVLKEEASFMIKAYLKQAKHYQFDFSQMSFVEILRFKHLLSKYKLDATDRFGNGAWYATPLLILFPLEEYNLKKGQFEANRSLPKEMDKYRNFKLEYNLDGMFALLPPGKNYGGLVKALMQRHISVLMSGSQGFLPLFKSSFHTILGRRRMVYNSKVYSYKQRIEFMQKLDIKEQDMALWSRLFDQQYPGYRNIHLFFGQVV